MPSVTGCLLQDFVNKMLQTFLLAIVIKPVRFTELDFELDQNKADELEKLNLKNSNSDLQISLELG